MKTANQPSLEVAAKFFRLLAKAGVEPHHIHLPNDNITARRNLACYLTKGCPKVSESDQIARIEPSSRHALYRQILGNDYITTEEVEQAWKFIYSEEEKSRFADTLPNAETVLWLLSKDYMLLAGPPEDLNLTQIWQLDKELFNEDDLGRWLDHDFAKNDKVLAGKWLLVRKGMIPESREKGWKKQQEFLREFEHVPNIAEIAYALTTYYKVRGERLLSGPCECVNTSSIYRRLDGDGPACIGRFSKVGIGIFCSGKKGCHKHAGISSAC